MVKADHMPGGRWKKNTNRLRKIIIPLSGGLLKLHLQCCVYLWHLRYKTKIDMLERVQWGAIKIIREWKHVKHKDWLRALGFFFIILEEKILMDNLISVLYYLVDRLEGGGGEELGYLEVHSKTMSSCKLLHKRSWLKNRKIFFTMMVVKHWSRFLLQPWRLKLNWKGHEQPDLM